MLFNALRLRATTLTDLILDGELIRSMLTSDDLTGLKELLALLEACHMLTNVQFNNEDVEGKDANRHQIKLPEAVRVRNAMVSLLESRGGTITFFYNTR